MIGIECHLEATYRFRAICTLRKHFLLLADPYVIVYIRST